MNIRNKKYMRLSKVQITWVKRNEAMIEGILKQRIEDLKDQVLDVPESKRSNVIAFINEYKAGLGLVKAKNKTKQKESFTGV